MEEGLDTLWIGVDCMGPKYAIRLPEVGSMGAVTVEPECKILLNPEWDRSATVHLLEFGPLSYKLVYSYGGVGGVLGHLPPGEFFLKLKDGTIYTPGDLKAGWGTVRSMTMPRRASAPSPRPPSASLTGWWIWTRWSR